MMHRESTSHRHSHILIILVSVLIGAVLSALVLAQLDNREPLVQPTPVVAATAPATFEDVAERTLPAVVYISSDIVAQPQRGAQSPQQMEELFRQFPFFRRYFDMPDGEALEPQQPQARPAAGSGWIYSEDGYIVTNAHVVSGARKVSVQLHDRENDKKSYPAEIVGIDPRSELAVIKVDAGRKLPTLKLANSDNARIGSWVMAVGSPFQLQQTVTVGVISARGREIDGATREFQIGDLLQTDASINPGNSGGPLVNTNGDVVGINVAIASPGATFVPFNIGIGFAIPANTAQKVVPELIRHGTVARGWLGVGIQDLNENLAQFFGAEDGGVRITEVQPEAPAAKSLQTDDIVVSVNGQRVRRVGELQRAIADLPPAAKVELEIIRNKQQRKVTVELGKMPARYSGLGENEQPKPPVPTQREEVAVLSITVSPLTTEIAEQLGIEAGKGVVVTAVGPDLADRLVPGDVVVRVHGEDVNTPAEFKAAVEKQQAAGQQFIVLHVQRKAADGRTVLSVVDIPLP